MTAFEHALSDYPDHPAAIVGVSNLLLDIFEQRLVPEPDNDNTMALSSEEEKIHAAIHLDTAPGAPNGTSNGANTIADGDLTTTMPVSRSTAPPSSAELNRIAARDRATGLLSSLTKLHEGWAISEAWFALARAHELSGQIDRAKECLWWVVKLEDGKPVRPWRTSAW